MTEINKKHSLAQNKALASEDKTAIGDNMKRVRKYRADHPREYPDPETKKRVEEAFPDRPN